MASNLRASADPVEPTPKLTIKERVTFSDLVQTERKPPTPRQAQLPMIMNKQGKDSDLFNELSKLKEFALKDEYAKKPTWNNLVNVVLTNMGKKDTGHVQEIFTEAKAKQRKENQMKMLSERFTQMLKKTQVDLFGKPKETLSEKIQGISDPALKQKYQSLESRYKEIKDRIESVDLASSCFQDYLEKVK